MATARVDWFRVIVELERAGWRISAISGHVDIPRESLRDYRNKGMQPRYEVGRKLLDLWRHATDQAEAPDPIDAEATPSVSRSKA